jgi:hypothetical protein
MTPVRYREPTPADNPGAHAGSTPRAEEPSMTAITMAPPTTAVVTPVVTTVRFLGRFLGHFLAALVGVAFLGRDLEH